MKFLLLFVFLLFAVLLFSCTITPHVVFPTTSVTVEVADSPEERERGLMGRESLAAGEGMLFVFEKPDTYGFWMKNTTIALDIIFLDAQKKVVDILFAVPCSQEPCEVYVPRAAALYALEVPKGFASSTNMQIGDPAQIVGVK